MKTKLLILNGALNGEHGQSGAIVRFINESNRESFEIKVLNLSTNKVNKEWEELLQWSEAFVFLTGTYWDSWGSPLQSFFEQMTHTEASSLWLGKPTACIVTMHSVGGKAVLSRLQGVLNTFGVVIPPLSGMVYSLTTHLANQTKNSHRDDFWQLDEIPLLLENLHKFTCMNKQIKNEWSAWPVDRADVTRPWLTKDDFKGIDQKP